MSNPKLLRYAVIALTTVVVLVVLVWRDNPLDSDVDTAAPPPATVDPSSSTTTEPATTTSEDGTTSSTGSTSTSTTTTTTTAPTSSTTTTTVVPEVDWQEIPESGEPAAVVTGTGVVLPVLGTSGDAYEAISPCGNAVTVEGEPLYGANIVLDPGHGGPDLGSVGSGVREKNVNLEVAEAAASMLEASGAVVVLTRSDDYEMSLEPRTELALRLQPQLFISVHHNEGADGPSDQPGSETYFQIASPDSRRAAGLVYEELVDAFDGFDAEWVADRDAGAKSRAASDGGDYYGILRLAAGVPTVVSEALYVDSPSEARLLRDPAAIDAEARAIARAALRYLGSDDPGSGFVDAYPREDLPPGPAAPRCKDPRLG